LLRGFGAAARLGECGAGRSGAALAHPPAAGTEAVAVAGDHDGAGSGHDGVERVVPGVGDDDRPDQQVEQSVDAGPGRADVAAQQRRPRNRSILRGVRGVGALQREHCAGHPVGAQVLEGVAGRGDTVDDHRGDRLAGA